MTDRNFIDLLVLDGGEVRRLPPPSLRTVYWLMASLIWLALVLSVTGLRPDLLGQFGHLRWVAEQGMALATAGIAAMAALCAGVPGRARWELFMPIVPAILWLSVHVFGLVEALAVGGFSSLPFQSDWVCLPGIILFGFGPGLAMVFLLRRCAPIHPFRASLYGGLAATSVADFGLRFFHPVDDPSMVIVWQLGAVLFYSLVIALVGQRFLTWDWMFNRRAGSG